MIGRKLVLFFPLRGRVDGGVEMLTGWRDEGRVEGVMHVG